MEEFIREVTGKLGGEEKIASTFRRCFENTVNTTVKRLEDETVYLITGDIPAMWLRDSSAQVRPCLYMADRDEGMAEMIEGLVKRQFRYILTDPYANAFNEKPDGTCWTKDEIRQSPWVWERKFEVDSLCYPLQLAWLLWKNTGRTGQFDAGFVEGAFKILEVFGTEQAHEEKSGYRFIRRDTYFTDTLSRDGRGALVKSGTGLVWSGFRPSDDACTYGYLIPSNMFAAVTLGYLEEIAGRVLRNAPLRRRASALREEIIRGIEQYGVTEKEGFGRVYAYETDGFGQYNLMDDANVPSLLSMDYIGYREGDRATAENTRRLILSEANPYYFKGREAAGIGSPHTPVGYVWHIALGMQGLTSADREEKLALLHALCDTDAGTGLMHESFDAEDSSRYTREWFSWANAVFCELALDYCGYRLKYE